MITLIDLIFDAFMKMIRSLGHDLFLCCLLVSGHVNGASEGWLSFDVLLLIVTPSLCQLMLSGQLHLTLFHPKQISKGAYLLNVFELS